MRRRYHSSQKGSEILHVWWMKVRMVGLRCMMYEWMLGLWGGCGLLLVGRVPWGLGTNPWLTPSTKLLSPHSWKTFQWFSFPPFVFLLFFTALGSKWIQLKKEKTLKDVICYLHSTDHLAHNWQALRARLKWNTFPSSISLFIYSITFYQNGTHWDNI